MNDIFVFSMLAWDSVLLHRSHMLSKYFAKQGMNVYYVEKVNCFNPFKLGKAEIESRDVPVVKIYALPYFRGVSRLVFRANDYLIRRALEAFTRDGGIKEALALLSTPHWAASAAGVDAFKGRIFYDISDDYMAFAGSPKWKAILGEYEERAVGLAERVFATAETLMHKAGGKGVLIENGVDLDGFGTADAKEFNTQGKVIGFIGGLYSWVDYGLIERVADAYPNDLLVLIGPTDSKEKMDRLSRLENVLWLGPVDKEEISDYYASFDIGIIPFLPEREYPRLKTVNSNKVYQYMYFGYPVVSTRFNQVGRLGDWVYVSDTRDEFIENIGEAKRRGRDRSKVDLNAISWETKALEMMKVFKGEIR